MSASAVKYVARFNGAIVGTRKSHRPYQFAVVAQCDEAHARAAAYGYTATDLDRRNFDYAVSIVACEGQFIEPRAGESDLRKPSDAGQVRKAWRTGRTYVAGYSAEEIAHAKADIEGGFDAHVARLKAEMIKRFERRKAEGGFQPFVSGWSMSRRNVEKMAASCRGAAVKVLAIVPAEVA